MATELYQNHWMGDPAGKTSRYHRKDAKTITKDLASSTQSTIASGIEPKKH